MFNATEYHALRRALAETPDLDRFGVHHLAHVRLNTDRAGPGTPRHGHHVVGSLRVPARIFGEPVNPACMRGIANHAVTARQRTVLHLRNAKVIGFNAAIDEQHVLYAPQDFRSVPREPLLRFNQTGRHGFVLTEQDGQLNAIHAQPPGRPRERHSAIFFHNVEPGNFGSFIFRQLPQMAYAREALAEAECYITPDRSPWFMEALSLLGLPPRPVFTTREVSGEVFRSLTIFDEPDAEGFLSREAYAGIDHLVAAASPENSPETSAGIYVSRSLSRVWRPAYRPMLNELDVEDFLATRGFQVVQPETLSLRQQIRCFAGARRIIGPSGSGMLNAVFARPGTRIVDMETFTDTVRQHAKLYTSRGLEYAFLFSTPEASDERPLFVRRWSVDMDMLEQATEWLLS